MAIGPVTWKNLVKRFKKCGFEGPYYGKGKAPHPFMKRGSQKIPIPNDHGQVLSVSLVSRLIRQAEISKEEWEAAR